MSITVTFNSFDEMLAFAKQIVGLPAVGQVKQNTPVVEKKNVITGETTTEPSNENNVSVDIEGEVPFEEEKTYTLEEVRAELAKLTRAGKQKEVKELLTSFGAKNLSSLDTKHYTAIMEKAGAL